MWTKFKLKRGRVIGLSLVLIPLLSLAVYAYKGTLLGAETSPDGQYIVKYYRSINPFLMFVPVFPGDSSCYATWVRLYNEYGDKLEELFTDDCQLMGTTKWFDDELFLSDDLTYWKLPHPVTKNTPISYEP